jgi:hypothetical protein
VPLQPFAAGKTVIVPLMGALVVFVAVKDPMLPMPFAPRPIAVLLFVQMYVVPLTGLPKLTDEVFAPLHKVWLLMVFTVGVGFTVMLKVVAAPVQPLADGVTVIVPEIGALVVLVAVNAEMFPVPLAPKPIAVFVFVQV